MNQYNLYTARAPPPAHVPPVPTCCNPCPLHDSCTTCGLAADSTVLLPGL